MHAGVHGGIRARKEPLLLAAWAAKEAMAAKAAAAAIASAAMAAAKEEAFARQEALAAAASLAASRAAFAAVAKRWRTTGDDRVDARAREVTRRVNARNMAGTVRARGKLTIDTIARSIHPSIHSIRRVDAIARAWVCLFFSPHTVPRVFSMGNTETRSSRYAATDLCERDTL